MVWNDRGGRIHYFRAPQVGTSCTGALFYSSVGLGTSLSLSPGLGDSHSEASFLVQHEYTSVPVCWPLPDR